MSAVQVRLAWSFAAFGSVGELAVRFAVATRDPSVSRPASAANVRVVVAPLASAGISQLTVLVPATRLQPVDPAYTRPAPGRAFGRGTAARGRNRLSSPRRHISS
nr:hypothetical protein [Kribbella steppae]